LGISLRPIVIGDCYSHNQNLKAIAISDHYTAATDDRCANFSASTRPTQARSTYSKLYSGQAATRKISSAA
jgi:hypothetical protein